MSFGARRQNLTMFPMWEVWLLKICLAQRARFFDMWLPHTLSQADWCHPLSLQLLVIARKQFVSVPATKPEPSNTVYLITLSDHATTVAQPETERMPSTPANIVLCLLYTSIHFNSTIIYKAYFNTCQWLRNRPKLSDYEISLKLFIIREGGGFISQIPPVVTALVPIVTSQCILSRSGYSVRSQTWQNEKGLQYSRYSMHSHENL